MSQKAYGSITIIDITDVGSFSVYPMSNMPLTVTYDVSGDPDNTNEKFSPNWADGSSHLVLTPMVYYAGNHITSGFQKVEWRYRYGVNNTGVFINSDDVVCGADGALTLKTNSYLDPNAGNTSGKLTFECYVEYADPISGAVVSAQGQITFTLLMTAPILKNCEIKGENVFLYDEDNDVKAGSENIKLTAHLQNVSRGSVNDGGGWFYYHVYDENWYSLGTDALLYTLAHDATIFTQQDKNGNNVSIDRLTLKYVTLDLGVYDEISVYKLRDGVSGSSVYSVVLGNEDQIIPFETDTAPSGGTKAYDLAFTTICVYRGADDVSDEWDINVESANNVTGDFLTGEDITEKIYKVSAFTPGTGQTLADIQTGYVIFKCQNKEDSSLVLRRRFTVTKVKVGQSPEFYSLEPSYTTVKRTATISGGSTTYSYSPTSITFSAYRNYYNDGWHKESYEGRLFQHGLQSSLQTQYNTNRSSAIHSMSSSSPSASHVTYYLYPAGTNYDQCSLYNSVNGVAPLDVQSVSIISDGQKGDKGDNGQGGYSLVVSNPRITIPCDSYGKVLEDYTFEIPVTLYQGLNKTNFTIDSDFGTPAGIEFDEEKSVLGPVGLSLYEQRKIIMTAQKGSDLGGKTTGQIVIDVSCASIDGTFEMIEFAEWVKHIQPRGAVTFELKTPVSGDDYTIHNGSGHVTFETILRDGTTVIDDNNLVSYEWYKYNMAATTKGYEKISDKTSSTLTVYADDVEHGYAAYKCIATYPLTASDAQTYEVYGSVQDIHDPLQATIVCSLGQQIINSQGRGAVYTRLMQNNEVVDAMPSELFLYQDEDVPANVNSYYKIIPPADADTPGRVQYRVRNGSIWSNGTHTSQYNYTYTFRDIQGMPSPDLGAITDRVFYIDADIVKKKLIVDVEVTEKPTSST